MQATEAFAVVKSKAEQIRNGDTQYFPEAASPGDWVRQGDLIITLLAEVPASAVKADPDAKLAPGETKGSRHILNSCEGVEFFKLKDADALQGPVFRCANPVEVTHPDHGNWILPPGSYSITHQRAYAEELRRVQD